MAEYLEKVRRATMAMTDAQRLRDEAIIEAVRHGVTQAEAAKAAKLTRQRVGQIMQGIGTAERAFWGAPDEGIVIAVGEKIEAPKDASGPLGPVVTTEAREAYDILRALAEQMGIDAEYEPIAPPGFVNLNREGLIVICGPRLSPMVAQVLESDQVLTFGKDAAGWHLADQRTGKTWHSPLDTGELADISYLGRLPRPDGRGTFLYIGGIHAGGTAGAASYLSQNLPELWSWVKSARFSALIRCTLSEARKVMSCELVAGPYVHEK